MEKIIETKKEHKGIIGDSALARMLDDIGNTSSEVLGLEVPGKKGNKKK